LPNARLGRQKGGALREQNSGFPQFRAQIARISRSFASSRALEAPRFAPIPKHEGIEGEAHLGQSPDWLARHIDEVAGCGGLSLAQLSDERRHGRGGFALTSPAFQPGGELDPCFTADEEDAVAPPLEWTAPPSGTQELALIVERITPDDKRAHCHWLVWGIPPQQRILLEGETPPRTGKNAFGNSEWLLPEPERGKTEYYLFSLFALDLPLTLMPGASREELIKQIEGHVIASAALVARYSRPLEDEDGWDDEDDDFE